MKKILLLLAVIAGFSFVSSCEDDFLIRGTEPIADSINDGSDSIISDSSDTTTVSGGGDSTINFPTSINSVEALKAFYTSYGLSWWYKDGESLLKRIDVPNQVIVDAFSEHAPGTKPCLEILDSLLGNLKDFSFSEYNYLRMSYTDSIAKIMGVAFQGVDDYPQLPSTEINLKVEFIENCDEQQYKKVPVIESGTLYSYCKFPLIGVKLNVNTVDTVIYVSTPLKEYVISSFKENGYIYIVFGYFLDIYFNGCDQCRILERASDAEYFVKKSNDNL